MKSKSWPKSTRWVISPSSIENRGFAAATGTIPHWKEAMCVNFWETIGQLERKKMWSESRTRPIRYWIRRGRHRREIRLDLDVRTLVLKMEIINDSMYEFSLKYQNCILHWESVSPWSIIFLIKMCFFVFYFQILIPCTGWWPLWRCSGNRTERSCAMSEHVSDGTAQNQLASDSCRVRAPKFNAQNIHCSKWSQTCNFSRLCSESTWTDSSVISSQWDRDYNGGH